MLVKILTRGGEDIPEAGSDLNGTFATEEKVGDCRGMGRARLSVGP